MLACKNPQYPLQACINRLKKGLRLIRLYRMDSIANLKRERFKMITENKIRPEYVSIYDIKNKHCGHWFSPGAMRFFNSRLPQGGYKIGNKAYFITSEQFDYKTPRYYTVRVIDWITGDVDTVGEFNKLTRSEANTALKHIINGGV